MVFPIKNSKDPKSLWHQLHPKSEMKWEWDEDGDNRVAKLWHLREELSRSERVVYSKWYKNRATLMSLDLFQALSKILSEKKSGLSFVSQEILDLLDQDSPISTRKIKEGVGLKGKEQERHYNAHMKELWNRLLIVGFGEFDDGAFPSLGVGSAKVLFEEDLKASKKLSAEKAWDIVNKHMPIKSLFRKHLDAILSPKLR